MIYGIIGFLIGVAVTLLVGCLDRIVEEEQDYFDKHDHDSRI